MAKGNKLKTIINLRCPGCEQESLFVHTNPYRYSGFFKMHDKCPTCGQKTMLEPGFFYGAMYVNYGLTIAICVAVFVAMYVLGSPWEIHEYLWGLTIALLLVAPYTFRLARILWLSMFVSYREPKDWPNAKKENS